MNNPLSKIKATKSASLSKEATESQVGHSKKRKKSDTAKDTNPSQPLTSNLVVTGMHTEVHVKSSSHSDVVFSSSIIIHSESASGHDASADSTAEVGHRKSAPKGLLSEQQGTLKKSFLPSRWMLLMAQLFSAYGKTGGFDQISNKDAMILYCLANGVHIDFARLIWEDLISNLKKKNRENVIPYTSTIVSSDLLNFDVILIFSTLLMKDIMVSGTNPNVFVDKTKSDGERLETIQTKIGTEKKANNDQEFNTSPELTSSDNVTREIKLEDLSKLAKNVVIKTMDLDSLKDDQPFIV
nr:hypothetical protein [Tanacetum cinerariifolium]